MIYKVEYISEKEKLWKPFLKKIGNDEGIGFSNVVERIKAFLEPVIAADMNGEDLKWDARLWRWVK